MAHTIQPASLSPTVNKNLLRQQFVALCEEAILFCQAKDPRQAAGALIKAIESVCHRQHPARNTLSPTAPTSAMMCALYREAAQLARQLFEYRNARRLLLHAHDHCSEKKVDSNDCAMMRIELAEISVIVGEHVSAERFFLESIRIGGRLDTLGVRTRIKGMQGLALLYAKEHRFSSADSLARESVEIVRKEFGHEHEEMAYSLALYGSIAKAAHRLDEALGALQQAVVLLEAAPTKDLDTLGELRDLLDEIREESAPRENSEHESIDLNSEDQTRELHVESSDLCESSPRELNPKEYGWK